MDIRNYLSLLVFLLCVSVFSQEELAYQTPKKELLKLIDVDLAPTVLSNTKNNVLVLRTGEHEHEVMAGSRGRMQAASRQLNYTNY